MSTQQITNTTIFLAQSVVDIVWPWVSGKRGLIILAAGIVTSGVALNWSWLVAAGLAPILLAVVPCVAMCALGLCMNKAAGKSSSAGGGGPGEKPGIKGGPEGGA